MEKKIDSIIDDLCKHEISKQEAKDRLLILFGVVDDYKHYICLQKLAIQNILGCLV